MGQSSQAAGSLRASASPPVLLRVGPRGCLCGLVSDSPVPQHARGLAGRKPSPEMQVLKERGAGMFHVPPHISFSWDRGFFLLLAWGWYKLPTGLHTQGLNTPPGLCTPLGRPGGREQGTSLYYLCTFFMNLYLFQNKKIIIFLCTSNND